MKFITVAVDMGDMSEIQRLRVPGQIDRILEPYHLKWVFSNMYLPEKGYDADLTIYSGKKALEETEWLKDKVYIGIMQSVDHCRLDDICIEGMSEPDPEKVKKYRSYFEEHGLSERIVTYPNPIVNGRDKKLLDGYISYLIMKEKGFTHAVCLLMEEGEAVKKYVCVVHMPGKNKKKYHWAYPLREAVVPGDLLLADTE